MGLSWQEYLAVGFPLVTAVVLAALFPISLKDYFVPGEIKKLGHGLTPYKLRARDYLHIFVLYMLSAVFLSLIQGYLLWDFAQEPALIFSSRFTDFILYPVFPSALMAVLLMLFVFSYIYVRRGEDDVRKFLLRTYDGWPLYREIPRFRPVALAAGILCTAANVWLYNVYVNVADEGIVYSTERDIAPVELKFDDILYLEAVEHEGGDNGREKWYSLRVRMKDRSLYNTKMFLLQKGDMLIEIDRIVRASERASGGYVDVITTKRHAPGKAAKGTLLDWDKGEGRK